MITMTYKEYAGGKKSRAVKTLRLFGIIPIYKKTIFLERQ